MKRGARRFAIACAAGLTIGTIGGANISDVLAGEFLAGDGPHPAHAIPLSIPTQDSTPHQRAIRAPLTATYNADHSLDVLFFDDPRSAPRDPEDTEDTGITATDMVELERRVGEMPVATGLPWNQTKGEQVVELARRYIGFPYVLGANGPYAYDCSSFTRHVFASFGVSLPRYSGDQVRAGTRIPASEAKPGDLMWWPGHVAIYTGNGNHIAARNPSAGIQEGPNYGSPVYVRVLPHEPGSDKPADPTRQVSPSPSPSASAASSPSPSPSPSANPSPDPPSPSPGPTTTPPSPSPSPSLTTPVPGELVELEAFDIALADGHQLRVGLTVRLNATATEGSTATIREGLVEIFSGRKLTEITTEETRADLEEQLLAHLNELLDGRVLDVQYTEFVAH